MPRNEPTPEKEALIQAYVEGHLTPEESVRLLDLVRDDPALARVIVENVRMDGAIREVVGERVLTAEPVRRPSSRGRITRRPGGQGMGPFLGILAAACLLLVIGLAIHAGRKPTPRPPSPDGNREARVPGIEIQEQAPRPPEPKSVPEAPRPPERAPVKREPPPAIPQKPPEPPKPEPPKPASPKPDPAPPVPKPETRSAVARVDRVEGEVHVVEVDGRKIPLAGPHDLLAGQRLETGAGRAHLRFPDQTLLVDMGSRTVLGNVRVEGGKTISLEQGEIRAQVTPQKDKPMVFVTPHGKATVKGTTLRIFVDAKATRLEVTAGKVELENLAGKAVLVESGHSAVAAADAALAARPEPKLLLEAEGGVVVNFGPDSAAGLALPDRWLGYRVLNDSGLEFDAARGYGWTEPNPVDPLRATKGKWHIPGFWDQSNKLQTDFMHATFVYGGSATETVEWRLALPSGRYQVAVSVGTYMFDQGPHHVKIQELQVIDRLMTKKGVFVPRQADVNVTNGELTMVLGGHGTPKTSDDTVVNYILIKRAKK